MWMFAIITHALTTWLLQGEKFGGRVRNWHGKASTTTNRYQLLSPTTKKNIKRDHLSAAATEAERFSVTVAQPTFSGGGRNAPQFLKHTYVRTYVYAVLFFFFFS